MSEKYFDLTGFLNFNDHSMRNRFLITKIFWNSLPGFAQIGISKVYTLVYKTSISRHFIKPFCYMNNLNENYLSLFLSERTMTSSYKSFQDFFCRKLIHPIQINQNHVWPCEGYICEQGSVASRPLIKIKGESKTLKKVFSATKNLVPDDYFYTNIFLHNKNYHRVHAPVSGQITRIEKIAGDLSILRPWFYRTHEISKPALRNERVNIDITDCDGKVWFLSIVGGMAVGTIELLKNSILNQKILCGDELALFRLGSTVCIASPVALVQQPYLKKVFIGQRLDLVQKN